LGDGATNEAGVDDQFLGPSQLLRASAVRCHNLIVDRKYQFVFIFPPVPVEGATDSNRCPIAVTRQPRTTEWAS
jgi:hypothetical protein